MLVSILICTYNGEKYIKKTITSAINQSYPNIEIIIVDDGSTDNTKKIIKDYSNKYENIKVFFQINKGLPNARNNGINKCNGEWIAFLDQDDLYEYNKIENQIKLSKKNKSIKFFFHDTNYINESDEIIDSHMKNFILPYPIIIKKLSTELLIKYGSYIDSESVFFKKDVIKNIGNMNTRFSYLCDYEFFIRVSLKYDIMYTYSKYSSWRIHDSQQQKNNKNQKKERILLFYIFIIKYKLGLKNNIQCLKLIFRNIISIIKDFFYDNKIS